MKTNNMKHIKLFEQFVEGHINKLNEYTTYNFKVDIPNRNDLKNAEDWLKKHMSKTGKTIKEATKRIKSFDGGIMFTYVQYHDVKPHGNTPDRPVFRLNQSQYWLNDTHLRGREEVNTTLLSIYDITEGSDKNSAKYIGQIYVSTDVFLDELPRTFEIIKRVS